MRRSCSFEELIIKLYGERVKQIFVIFLVYCCGFAFAENVIVNTNVETEKTQTETVPANRGWDPDMPVNSNNNGQEPKIQEGKQPVKISNENSNKFTFKATAKTTLKADKICVTAYIKSSDSVTSNRADKSRTIAAAVKSIDDKIVSFKSRLYFAYLKKRAFEVEKIDEPVIQMGSEISKPGSTISNYYNSMGEYVIEISATSTDPSIAYHYCATQKIKIITDPKDPEELIKTLNWCGAVYNVDKIEFNSTLSSAVKFFGIEVIQKSKVYNRSYNNDSRPSASYVYAAVDRNGNEIPITSPYAADSRISIKKKVEIVDGRVVEKEEIDDTISKNEAMLNKYKGPKIQYTVSRDNIDKVGPGLIKAAIAKGKEQAKEVAKSFGATIEGEPLEISQKIEANISNDSSGDVMVTGIAIFTYKAKY